MKRMILILAACIGMFPAEVLLADDNDKSFLEQVIDVDNNQSRIARAIQKILRDGAWGSFLILDVDTAKNYYLQCSGQRDIAVLHCEAVSNQFLKEPFLLDEPKITQLLALGWHRPDPTDDRLLNYYIDWDTKDDRIFSKIADNLIETLAVYGFPKENDVELEVNLE